MAQIDWSKQGAIAGYGGWLFAALNIGGMFWIAYHPFSASAQIPQSSLAVQPGGTPLVIPSWALVVAPTIYAIAAITAAVFHFRARQVQLSCGTNRADGTTDARSDNPPRQGEIDGLTSRLAECLRALKIHEDREASERDKASSAQAFLANAPRLWVEYEPESKQPRKEEALKFSREGESAITGIMVCPLTWRAEEKYPITLFNNIGPLRSDPFACSFTAFKQVGNSQQLFRLPDLYREMMLKFGSEIQPQLEISYSDMTGNRFSITFTLSIDLYNRIVFEPGPVGRVAN
jgi:hypothetical protein